MHFKTYSWAATILVVSTLGAGCTIGSSAPVVSTDGGIWKTSDGGLTWVAKKALVISGPEVIPPKVTGNVAAFSIQNFAPDPQDPLTIYAGTLENGLIYTYDGGESWRQSIKPLDKGHIRSVVVDPKNKCTIYATLKNEIYKTETCGRDWQRAFFDSRVDKAFTSLVVDWYNSAIVYAGTTAGDVFRSNDGGTTWQISKRQTDITVNQLVIHPKDSRIVYAATLGDGIWKTMDGGETWSVVKQELREDFPEARRVIQLVVDPVEPSTIYNVSKYGIIKSKDAGATWTALTLTGAPKSLNITAIAIDPKNNQRLVFTGVNALQFTTDGGQTWRPEKLPSSQTGSALLYDAVDSNKIYLGTLATKKK